MHEGLVSFGYGAYFNRISVSPSVSHLYTISAYVTHSQVFPHQVVGVISKLVSVSCILRHH